VDVGDVIEAIEASSAFRATSFDASAGSGNNLAGSRGSVDGAFAESEDRIMAERLLRHLPDRERSILELRFFDHLSQAEIGDRVGISQMHVSRLIRKSLLKLRELATGSGHRDFDNQET
jgi:RNA polymerase sigma-B factor